MKISAPEQEGFQIQLSGPCEDVFDLMLSVLLTNPPEVFYIAIRQNPADDEISVTVFIQGTNIPE